MEAEAEKEKMAGVEVLQELDAFEEETLEQEETVKKVSDEDWEAVKREVLTIVGKRYLEPHLKRVDVIRDVSYMKHTLAGSFITQVGFYKLVNAYRIRHYEKLMEDKSSARMSQDAIAELCGFKNRWALTNAKKRLNDFDYNLIEEYV